MLKVVALVWTVNFLNYKLSVTGLDGESTFEYGILETMPFLILEEGVYQRQTIFFNQMI